ncbi:hypothetical protein KI387_018884, partial [Taxus chinensis]
PNIHVEALEPIHLNHDFVSHQEPEMSSFISTPAESFSWLKELRREESRTLQQEITPNFESISKYMRTKRGKRAQVASCFYTEEFEAQYVEVAHPRVNKPMGEITPDDY